jgi:hypothetical protein
LKRRKKKCEEKSGVARPYLRLWADFLRLQFLHLPFGLSDQDYDYVKTQHIERDDAPILDLSPKEQVRLHNLINDLRTANDPVARDKNVKDVLAIFLQHQLWEKAHPGELWDAPKR